MSQELKARSAKLLNELKDFMSFMEDVKLELEEEQSENEQERADWDEESGDVEPDEIDNEPEIGLLRTQLLDLESVIEGFREIKEALR